MGVQRRPVMAGTTRRPRPRQRVAAICWHGYNTFERLSKTQIRFGWNDGVVRIDEHRMKTHHLSTIAVPVSKFLNRSNEIRRTRSTELVITVTVTEIIKQQH